MATKLLKELHKEAKTNRRWMMSWSHSLSRYSHKRSLSQGPVEQISCLMKTIPLLGEFKVPKLSGDQICPGVWPLLSHKAMWSNTGSIDRQIYDNTVI